MGDWEDWVLWDTEDWAAMAILTAVSIVASGIPGTDWDMGIRDMDTGSMGDVASSQEVSSPFAGSPPKITHTHMHASHVKTVILMPRHKKPSVRLGVTVSTCPCVPGIRVSLSLPVTSSH